MFTQLRSVVAPIMSLTETEWRHFESAFTFRQVPKKFQLAREGDIAGEIYFINKGVLRLYYNKEGAEITAFIFTENLFASSYESFLSKSPGIQYLDALEPCELLVMTNDALQQLYVDVPKINVLVRVIAEQRFINAQRILSSYIMETPEERYRKYAREHADILQRVPQHIIASFLGITPVSLSRIRSRRTVK